MIGNEKLKELEKGIEEKRRELQTVLKKRAAAGDPAQMVALDKQVADLQDIISALERTRQVVSYVPPRPTEKQAIVSCLDKYIDKKREKVQKVQDSLDQVRMEIRDTEQRLDDATVAGDVDAVIDLSGKLKEQQEKLKYIERMKEDTEMLQTFPDGAVAREWENVCEGKRMEWNLLLIRIGMLADEYRRACSELIAMKDTLLSARSQICQIAAVNGSEFNPVPILTRGLDVEPLKISKMDGQMVGQVKYASVGRTAL